MIRHGEYLLQGSTGHSPESELSPVGIRQAKLTGKRFAELDRSSYLIYSSTMRRASQTANLIAGCWPSVPLNCRDDLRECDQSQIPIPLHSNFDLSTSQAPGPCSAFRRLFQPTHDSTARIIVCHGNIICYFLARIQPAVLWRYVPVPNCSITTINLGSDGQLDLVSFADIEHLPADFADN